MSLEGAKVEAVCELMSYSGGLTRNIVQCLHDYDIPLYLSTTVVQIHGKERLTGVTISQVDENRKEIPETRRFIACDTLLLSCGLIPENELTQAAGIAMDGITGGAVVDQSRQTSVEGIFACGNVLQVHDLVDYVSDEAEMAGIGAADFVAGVRNSVSAVATHVGNGVRYVLPQRVNKNGKEVSLFLRVDKPYGKVRFTVTSGDEILVSAVRLKAAPGEMEKLRVPADKLSRAKELTVSLEEIQ